MNKLFLILVSLIFTCSSDLFAQDYMKMRKKQLRIEHQKKLKFIDSLSQELRLSNKKSQNLQSDLNNSSNDLILTSDSLQNSNLEITKLEAKLSNSNVELTQLVLEMKGFVSQDSLKNIAINSLKKENEDLKKKLYEPIIVRGELQKYEDDECYESSEETTAIFKKIIIKTVRKEESCGAGSERYNTSNYYNIDYNGSVVKKELKNLFKNTDALLKLININFEEYFYELFKNHKECMEESIYNNRSWESIGLHISNYNNDIFFSSDNDVAGYCEGVAGTLDFYISFAEISEFVK
ncbi:MAG: hypothetical protein P8O09_01765 [Flavobacteriaceae bacterium]|nr:hypothetical protein [Flavobacteriaceae bacterium]